VFFAGYKHEKIKFVNGGRHKYVALASTEPTHFYLTKIPGF